MSVCVSPSDSSTIERPTGRASWLVSGWRALVGLTLEAGETAPRSELPRHAETVAAARDSAAPTAV
jgi:hypothetical protein